MTWIIKPSKHGGAKHEKKKKEMNYNKLLFNENDTLFLQYAIIQTCINFDCCLVLSVDWNSFSFCFGVNEH